VGSAPPWAGVTPAPSIKRKVARSALLCFRSVINPVSNSNYANGLEASKIPVPLPTVGTAVGMVCGIRGACRARCGFLGSRIILLRRARGIFLQFLVQLHYTTVTNPGVAVSLEDRLEVLIWRFAAEAATRSGPNLLEVETDLFLREIRLDPLLDEPG
jgi:hypothetical protein